MTKEQAIEIIESERPKDLKREHRAQRFDAFTMAIDALKLMPDEDCVSREAVLDCFYLTNARAEARHAVESLPSVRPKPIHGEWLENEYGETCCDKCGYAIPEGAEEAAEYWDYCPGCGVRMTEEDEE